MFELNDKLVIFDISNTYFETTKRKSKLAKHGRRKAKRLPVSCIYRRYRFLWVIRHSRIYEGNKADASTLADMLSDPTYGGDACGKDAGIATVENLKLITEKGYRYVCTKRFKTKKGTIHR